MNLGDDVNVILGVVGVIILFFAVNWIFMLPAWLGGYRMGRYPPRRSPGHFFLPGASVQMRGSSIVGFVYASWPLAGITIDSEWAFVSGIMSAWIDRSRVTSIRKIGGPFGGLHFDTDDGHLDGVLFWAGPKSLLRENFLRFGWPAEF